MLHAADVEAIQELKKKAEEEAVKRRELEIQVAKASSILQEKVAAWNIVERQLKVGRLQLRICTQTWLQFKRFTLIKLFWLKINLGAPRFTIKWYTCDNCTNVCFSS